MVHREDRFKETPSPQTVRRVAYELDMDELQVFTALRTTAEAPYSVLDETLGPSTVAAAAPLRTTTSAAARHVRLTLQRHQLSPVGGAWLQDRGSWPDPMAESAVTRVSVWVDQSTVRVVADVTLARRGYLTLAILSMSLLPLFVLAAGFAWGLLAGTLVSLGAVGAITLDYRNRLGTVERNLVAFADAVSQPVMPPSVIG